MQRTSHVWTLSLYDLLGRHAVSGTVSGQFDFQSEPYRDSLAYAVMPKSPSYSGVMMGYEAPGISLSPTSLLSVDYYDGYGFLGNGIFPSASSPAAAYDANPGAGFSQRYSASSHGMPTGSVERVLDGSSQPSYIWHILYHDDRGRVVQDRSSSHTGGVLKGWYGHSFTDEVTKEKRSFVPASGSAVTETLTYTYDNSGRPLTTTLILNGGIPVTVESNSYDGVGRLLSTSRAGNAALTSSFSYNVRSWMTSVSGSLFSETLHYQDGTTPQWGGNISSMEWNAGGENESRRYNFTYDKASRLTAAAYKEDHVNGAFSESYTYDRNGNLYKLTRYGLNSAGTARTALLSSLTFTRSGNWITKIGTDAAATVGYDAKGRMTSYNYGGTSSMTHNVLDLPLSYTKGNTQVEWKYSAGGVKLQEKTTVTAGGQNSVTTVDHVGDFVLTDGALTRVDFAGGFVDMTGSSPQYLFFLKDHLGSVRVVADAQGNVHQVNHYYPYGDRFADPRYTVSSAYPAASGNGTLFAGKELEGSSGLYDFEARFDNTFLGRFTTMDPMAEKYYSISPYTYCAGNPVNLVDPWGLTAYMVNGDRFWIDDGYDETIYLTKREYRGLNRDWNRGHGEAYDYRRQSLMDKRGYIDPDGNAVLAASSVSSSNSIFRTSYSALVFTFSSDLATPDPSDLSLYKWAAYAAGGAITTTGYYISKMEAEMSLIDRRPDGPVGVQYSLRATSSGMYPNVRGGQVFLNTGDVWKYGETTQNPPEKRYGGIDKLHNKGLEMHYDFRGTQKQIKREEKRKLYFYFFNYQHLPPGNSIFR